MGHTKKYFSWIVGEIDPRVFCLILLSSVIFFAKCKEDKFHQKVSFNDLKMTYFAEIFLTHSLNIN